MSQNCYEAEGSCVCLALLRNLRENPPKQFSAHGLEGLSHALESAAGFRKKIAPAYLM